MRKFLCVLSATFVIFLLSLFIKTGISSGEIVCEVNMANIPDGTVFVELFVEEDMLSDNYTECNEIAVKKNNISPKSEIVTTKFDDFVSYTYHHKNSSSLSNLNDCETVYNGEVDDEFVHVVFWNGIQRKSIEKCDALMLVYVDEFGQILGKCDVVYVSKLMEKSHFIVDGKVITVKYNDIKTSVKLLLFISLVLIETALFIISRRPIRGRSETTIQSRSNQAIQSGEIQSGDGSL